MNQQPSAQAQELHRRAITAFGAGAREQAMALMRESIELAPASAVFHSNFGVMYRMLGQMDDAIAEWQRAVELDPNTADAHINLAAALREGGEVNAAIIHGQRAVEVDPFRPASHINLAAALIARREFEQAANVLNAMLARFPAHPEAEANLALIEALSGDRDAAIERLRRLVAAHRGFVPAMHFLARALRGKGNVDEAIALWQSCVAIDPNHAEAWNNLGAALMDCGQFDQALAAYRAATIAAPKFAAAHSNLVYALHFDPSRDAMSILAEHRQWDRLHAQPLRAKWRPHANDRSPDRLLRIGYLSPDFRQHSVGRAALPLLSHHDSEHFEIVCYSDSATSDELTAELRPHARWIETAALSDTELAERIRDDRIDILIDLAQHMAGNRMLVMARKPAPVQATHIGYPATTGVAAIDYRITDALLDPPGETEAFNSEQLIRLPHSFYCYRGPDLTPRSPSHGGTITFGSLNSLFKISDRTIEVWSKVLHAVTDSRLIIPHPPAQAEHLLNRFRRHGLEAERIELLPRLPIDRYFRAYDRIDIALDTLPYNGGVTTCDALWMGVPVISRRGETSVGRAGASILTNVRLTQLLAESDEQFVSIAIELAGDPSRLGDLRNRMRQSPICHEAAYTRGVEAAYRTMWRRWIQH